jgi:hypothetical protein
MIDRVSFCLFDALGYSLCELAFKADCRGPFVWAYRAGCWFYGHGTDSGIRSGDLIENPGFRPGSNEPLYVRRSP